ncbi:MAG: hypothetical protein ABJG42_05150 [Vibrio splendidus]
MNNFLVDPDVQVTETVDGPLGRFEAGQKIIIQRALGSFNGLDLFVPPLQFEGLFVDKAIEEALLAKESKDKVLLTTNFTGPKEILISKDNNDRFKNFCQHQTVAIFLSVSALESWAHGCITQFGIDQLGEPMKLVYTDDKKEEKETNAKQILKNPRIASLNRLIIQILPQVFRSKSFKPKSPRGQTLKALIDSRNTVAHLQKAGVSGEKYNQERLDFCVNLYQKHPYWAIQEVLNVMHFFYDTSTLSAEKPHWLTQSSNKLDIYKK